VWDLGQNKKVKDKVSFDRLKRVFIFIGTGNNVCVSSVHQHIIFLK